MPNKKLLKFARKKLKLFKLRKTHLSVWEMAEKINIRKISVGTIFVQSERQEVVILTENSVVVRCTEPKKISEKYSIVNFRASNDSLSKQRERYAVYLRIFRPEENVHLFKKICHRYSLIITQKMCTRLIRLSFSFGALRERTV